MLAAFAHALEILTAAGGCPQATVASVRLIVSADGEVRWNGEHLDGVALEQRMAQAAARQPQPEIEVAADRATQYGRLAEVLAAASRAGLARIGLITRPATPP